jgi:hypothetical protein
MTQTIQPPTLASLQPTQPALWVDYDEWDQPSYRGFVISRADDDERFDSGDLVDDFRAAQRRFAELGGTIVLSSFFDFFRDGNAWDLTADGPPATWAIAPGPQPWRPTRAPAVSP